jgi:Mce-associated membrane protein
MSDEITGNSAKSGTATSVAPNGKGPALDGTGLLGDVEDVEEPGDAEAAEVVEGVEEPGAAEAAPAAAEAVDAVKVVEDVENDADVEAVADVEGVTPSDVEAVTPSDVEAERNATATEAKPASGPKAEHKANGSGAKAEHKANGSKSPKKSKKKSSKAKPHNEKSGGAVTTPDTSASEALSVPVPQEMPGEPPPHLRHLLVDNSLAVILGVVAILLAVALALTALQLGDKGSTLDGARALDGARTSALAAARTYAVELAGYDYRHLDQDFGVVLSHSTPSFASKFSKSSDVLKSALLKYHASAKATVVAAGLVSATTGQAVALVFLDQTVTNSTQKKPTTDQSQVEITLVRTGGSWLINQVKLP